MEPVNDPRLYSHRYQVTHLIARGGMAMVYRAQDTLLNRAVALKILYPELSEDPLFVERFRREAQAAANLSHPNIVPVFDWGEDGETYFIVMELVDGVSLAEMLRSSVTLTAARSAQIVAQVAAALGYAHRSGVVHRDVKPGNILITRDGQVKVTDFGIAQAVSSEDHLAEAGSVMGTATYFSPEQAEGAAVDGRSDVYSLGVVLYEMLVGRPPFVGDTPVEVSSQHVHNAVPPMSQFSSSVPSDLEAIVMEALNKSPSNRYQSADELRADLIRFSEGQPVHAAMRDAAFFGADATRSVAAVVGERTRSVPIMQGPRTDVRRRRRSYSGVILILVLLLIGGGVYAFLQHNKTTDAKMPGVVGQQETVAAKQLKDDGLVVDVTPETSTKPKNTVLSTSPKKGAEVTKGDAVTLFVSKGITTVPETVPDVSGMPVSSAISSLQSKKLGYKISQTTTVPPGSNPAPDTELTQTPAAGTKVQSGAVVVITVLATNAKYPVDDVDGEGLAQAGATLNSQGLTVGKQTQGCSNTVKQGLVIATVPPSGSLVTSGTAITLEVSSGNCQAAVPNAVGDTEAQAGNLMAQYGFQPSYTLSTTQCDPGVPQTVVSQSQSPGSSVPYGSIIDMQVCTTTAPTTTTTAPGPPTS
jgi:beta-lactam-binding protein with PASTA domain/tRNA A-37 threonylcarbamoyl transferase component Bud32